MAEALTVIAAAFPWPPASRPTCARLPSRVSALDSLRREFLAPSIAGEPLGSIGVSEVGGGSDVATIKTTARKDGGDYLIDGSKHLDHQRHEGGLDSLKLVNTGEGPAHKNKSLIVVPLNVPGVTRQKIKKLGMLSSDTAQLFFEGVYACRATT